MKKHIPNILTVSRLLMIPLFLFFIISNREYSYHYALLIFILASITDALDGRFARKFNVESKFGEFLDPLADKILILSAFIVFLTIDLLGDAIKPWMVALIFFRDFLVTILRIVINSMGLSMITSRVAKLKTAFQLISIVIILSSLSFYPNYSYNNQIIKLLMITVTLFTVYTGIDYYLKNLKLILSENR